MVLFADPVSYCIFLQGADWNFGDLFVIIQELICPFTSK